MLRYYLGIDGGQSSTTALIADEDGRIVGYGRGGPCNHVAAAEGRQKFFRAVGECLSQAFAQASLDSKTTVFASACLGFSGGAEDKDAYARELIRSKKYKITHDAETALSGATVGEPGIVIIAGTGSMAFGRNAAGQTSRAGGWGYIFGDEGGAFDLTRRALRAALRQEENWGPATRLFAMLLKMSGATSANTLLHRFYADLDRPAIAALSVLVTQAAVDGDAVASSILQEAASHLVWYVEGVYRHLFPNGESVPIVYIGGTFRSDPLRSFFASEIQKRIGCEVGPPLFSPAAGALLEALRIDGNHSTLSNIPASEK
jgi:glucosamine kinase